MEVFLQNNMAVVHIMLQILGSPVHVKCFSKCILCGLGCTSPCMITQSLLKQLECVYVFLFLFIYWLAHGWCLYGHHFLNTTLCYLVCDSLVSHFWSSVYERYSTLQTAHTLTHHKYTSHLSTCVITSH